jgi:hypothetical protein
MNAEYFKALHGAAIKLASAMEEQQTLSTQGDLSLHLHNEEAVEAYIDQHFLRLKEHKKVRQVRKEKIKYGLSVAERDWRSWQQEGLISVDQSFPRRIEVLRSPFPQLSEMDVKVLISYALGG